MTAAAQQQQLLDKAMALIATGEPLAFQAVQFMNSADTLTEEPYDPSDEGEFRRIADRTADLYTEGDGHAPDGAALAEFGIDPFYAG